VAMVTSGVEPTKRSVWFHHRPITTNNITNIAAVVAGSRKRDKRMGMGIGMIRGWTGGHVPLLF